MFQQWDPNSGQAPPFSTPPIFGPSQQGGGVLGGQGGWQALLNSPQMQQFALQLMANSGPSPVKRNFGQIAAQSMLGAQEQGERQKQSELERRYREAQIAQMEAPAQAKSPASVQEYEYAKQNGYEGSFQDWITAGGQSSRPSNVLEYEFYNSLPTEQKKLYLEMKRNPNIVIKDVGGVPSAIDPTRVGGTQTTPLSTLPAEAAAAGTIKQGEVEGAGRGEAATVFQKKATGAKNTVKDLDIADSLIDAATGSLAGAGRDKLAAVFGKAPEGAQAIAQLKVIQASLMTSMPRMEGPQSDRDVQLYRDAAGQIGDPTVPSAIKKAAVRTIRQLQKKYLPDDAPAQNGARKRYNPATKSLEAY